MKNFQIIYLGWDWKPIEIKQEDFNSKKYPFLLGLGCSGKKILFLMRSDICSHSVLSLIIETRLREEFPNFRRWKKNIFVTKPLDVFIKDGEEHVLGWKALEPRKNWDITETSDRFRKKLEPILTK